MSWVQEPLPQAALGSGLCPPLIYVPHQLVRCCELPVPTGTASSPVCLITLLSPGGRRDHPVLSPSPVAPWGRGKDRGSLSAQH